MQLRTPVLKPENSVRSPFEVRSQPVRMPSNASRQKIEECDVALVPSGRWILPFGRPVLKRLFPVFLIACPDKPTYRPDGPLFLGLNYIVIEFQLN
jgi:hypothetical protein